MSICLCHIKKPVFPCFKRTGCIQGMCLCVFACMCTFACLPSQACMFPQIYLSFAVLHAWECWRHSVNDNYDDGVCLSAEVEKGRRGLNECSVRRSRERRASQEERGSAEDGEWGRGVNTSLCGEREKRESLLWYVYMSMKSLVWLIISMCLCVSVCVPVFPNGFPHWNTWLPHSVI